MARRKNSGEGKMFDPSLIEAHYKKFRENILAYLPEGVVTMDIEKLHDLDLLDYELRQEEALTRYFHVLETAEKITLVNDEFIVWIVPENDESPKTLVLIALNDKGVPRLELAFLTTDVYNTSKLVLRILEKFLHEIQENEESLRPYKFDKGE